MGQYLPEHVLKRRAPMIRSPEVLDVQMTAALLTMFVDTVYELFQSRDLSGRKVGRKWITTKAAVLRCIENSATGDALAEALNKGTARPRQ